MMIVAYLLDRDIDVTLPAIPALAPIPASVTGILEFSVEQEQAVTRQFEQIIAAARNDQDYLAEQFTHWFLKGAGGRGFQHVDAAAGGHPVR